MRSARFRSCSRSATRTAIALRTHPYDLIVLVDFGAFNLRLARMIRALGSQDADPVLFSARRVVRRYRARAQGRRTHRSADRVRASARFLPVVGLADRLVRPSARVDDRAARARVRLRRPTAASSRCCPAAARARSRATRRDCSTRSRCCARSARTSRRCSRRSTPPPHRRSKNCCACVRRCR